MYPIAKLDMSVKAGCANGMFDLSGTVADTHGQPLDEVRIEVKTYRATGREPLAGTVETEPSVEHVSADRSFAVHVPRAAAVELWFRKDGYETAAHQFLLADDRLGHLIQGMKHPGESALIRDRRAGTAPFRVENLHVELAPATYFGAASRRAAGSRPAAP
jgi:hypothetical protein